MERIRTAVAPGEVLGASAMSHTDELLGAAASALSQQTSMLEELTTRLGPVMMDDLPQPVAPCTNDDGPSCPIGYAIRDIGHRLDANNKVLLALINRLAI